MRSKRRTTWEELIKELEDQPMGDIEKAGVDRIGDWFPDGGDSNGPPNGNGVPPKDYYSDITREVIQDFSFQTI